MRTLSSEQVLHRLRLNPEIIMTSTMEGGPKWVNPIAMALWCKNLTINAIRQHTPTHFSSQFWGWERRRAFGNVQSLAPPGSCEEKTGGKPSWMALGRPCLLGQCRWSTAWGPWRHEIPCNCFDRIGFALALNWFPIIEMNLHWLDLQKLLC